MQNKSFHQMQPVFTLLFLATLGLGIFALPFVGHAQPGKPASRGATSGPAIYLPLIFDGAGADPIQPTSTPMPTSIPTATPTQTEPSIDFAVIGDYGSGDSDEGDVARLIDSWNVDFVITVGDNNYLDGEAATIDANIGQFYHSYIWPYTGKYGPGADRNRFFPTLGNHDWVTSGAQPYLDYFTLPGNERYYDFVWGPVHFFALDSNWQEPDGRTATSRQAQWLQGQMARSTSEWQVVFLHHAPFSSGSRGETADLQWPYQSWGADLVLSAHNHTYERLLFEGLTYVVSGLGGYSIHEFQDPLPYGPGEPVESMLRYNEDFGALRVEVDHAQLYAEFINRDHAVIDSFSLTR